MEKKLSVIFRLLLFTGKKNKRKIVFRHLKEYKLGIPYKLVIDSYDSICNIEGDYINKFSMFCNKMNKHIRKKKLDKIIKKL
jgi:hypothetical protein